MNKLLINSKDLLNGNVSDGYYKLQNIIENKSHLCLEHFYCPNTIYNVTSINNNIRFTDGVTTWNTSIAIGAYNSTSLLSAIKTAMDAVSGLVFTLSLNSITLKVTISCPTAFRILFASGSNQINNIIGFPKLDTSLSTSQVATNIINLGFPTHILMYIFELGVNFNATNSNNLGSFIIPIVTNTGDSIIYNSNSNFKQESCITEKSIKNLQITLRDLDNNVIDLNGSNYTIILSIY